MQTSGYTPTGVSSPFTSVCEDQISSIQSLTLFKYNISVQYTQFMFTFASNGYTFFFIFFFFFPLCIRHDRMIKYPINSGSTTTSGQIYVNKTNSLTITSTTTRSLMCGNAPSGIGLFKKLHSGCHPCLTSNTSSFSSGTVLTTYSVHASNLCVY